MICETRGGTFGKVQLCYELFVLVQLYTGGNDCDEIPFLVQHGVGIDDCRSRDHPSLDVFPDGEITRPDGVPDMLPVREVDAAGGEGRGRGKHVAVGCHRVYDGIGRVPFLYIGKQPFAGLGVNFLKLRPLRQHPEHLPRAGRELLLLCRQALRQMQDVPLCGDDCLFTVFYA